MKKKGILQRNQKARVKFRNITFGLSIFAIAGSIFVGCNKKEEAASIFMNSQKITSSIELSSNMLQFDSPEELENFYTDDAFKNGKMTSSTYTPLRSNISVLYALEAAGDSVGVWTSPHLSDTLYSDYDALLDLVNQDRLVGIGDYIVRLDLHNDRLFTTLKSEPNAVENILSAVDANDAVNVYGSEVELIPILFKINIFNCKDAFADKGKDKRETSAEGVWCSTGNYRPIRTKKELTYQHAGVYFRIIAEGKSQRRTMGIWWDYDGYPTIPSINYTFTPKCKPMEYWSGSPSSVGAPKYITNADKTRFRAYESWTALKNYNVYADIAGCGGTHTLHIAY